MKKHLTTAILCGLYALGTAHGSHGVRAPDRALASAPLKMITGYMTCSNQSRSPELNTVHLIVSADVLKKIDELNFASNDEEHTLRRSVIVLEAGTKPGSNRWFTADVVLNPTGFVKVSYSETLSLGKQRRISIDWAARTSGVTYTSKVNSPQRSPTGPQSAELTCDSIRI